MMRFARGSGSAPTSPSAREAKARLLLPSTCSSPRSGRAPDSMRCGSVGSAASTRRDSLSRSLPNETLPESKSCASGWKLRCRRDFRRNTERRSCARSTSAPSGATWLNRRGSRRSPSPRGNRRAVLARARKLMRTHHVPGHSRAESKYEMPRRSVISVLLLAAVFALPGVVAACGVACCAGPLMSGGDSPALTCCDSGMRITCATSGRDAPQGVVSKRPLSDTAEVSTAASAPFAIRIVFSARLSPTILPRSSVNLTILHAQLLI